MVHGKRIREHVRAEDGGGEWTGTMNSTEPQCGNRSRPAAHQGGQSGRRQLQDHGTKIFISAGEHDLARTSSIWMLARIEGAPEAFKGVSLFVVPKIWSNPNGRWVLATA